MLLVPCGTFDRDTVCGHPLCCLNSSGGASLPAESSAASPWLPGRGRGQSGRVSWSDNLSCFWRGERFIVLYIEKDHCCKCGQWCTESADPWRSISGELEERKIRCKSGVNKIQTPVGQKLSSLRGALISEVEQEWHL